MQDDLPLSTNGELVQEEAQEKWLMFVLFKYAIQFTLSSPQLNRSTGTLLPQLYSKLHSYQSARAVTAFLKPLHLKIAQFPLFFQRKVFWQ